MLKKELITPYKSSKTYFFSIIFIIIIQLLLSFVLLGIQHIASDFDSNNTIFQLIASTVLQGANLFALLYVLSENRIFSFSVVVPFAKESKELNVESLKLRNFYIVLAVLAVLVAFVCLFCFMHIANWFSYFLYKIGYNSSASMLISTPLEVVIAIVPMCILAPFFEEHIYRGVVLSGLNKKINKHLAVFASAFLFAFMHMNPEQLIYQFILGIVLGYMFLASGRLFFSIIVHSASNLIAIIMTLLSKNSASNAYSEFTANYLLVTIGATIIGVVVLFSLYVYIRDTLQKSFFYDKENENEAKEVFEEDIEEEEQKVEIDVKEPSAIGYYLIGLGISIGMFIYAFVHAF